MGEEGRNPNCDVRTTPKGERVDDANGKLTTSNQEPKTDYGSASFLHLRQGTSPKGRGVDNINEKEKGDNGKL